MCSFYAVAQTQHAQKKSFLQALELFVPVLLVAVLATVWVVQRPEVFAAATHRSLIMLGATLANQTVCCLCLMLFETFLTDTLVCYCRRVCLFVRSVSLWVI